VERLDREKEQTEEAVRRADTANLKLEQARYQQQLRMDARRKEAQEAKKRNKSIEVQIAKGKTMLENVEGVLRAEQDAEMRMLQNNVSDILKDRETIARQIPSALANRVSDDLLEAAIEIRHAEKASLAQVQRLHQAKAVEGAHKQDVELTDKQHDQWLKEAKAEGQRIAVELENCRERHQQWHKHVREDLLDAHGLGRQLATVIDAMEGGGHDRCNGRWNCDGYRCGVPSNVCCEVRAPSLQLAAIRARIKDEVVPDSIFEELFRGVGDLRQRLAAYEKVLQKEWAGDREISRVRALLPSGPYSLQMAGPTFAPTVDCRFHWLPTHDADLFARDFCDIRDADGVSDASLASEMLRRLKAPELRALCLALRRRVRNFPGLAATSSTKQEAEKARLRDEVATNLTSHDRVEQIRQLEKDIADVKVRIVIEEGQARQLEIAVQSFMRSTSRPTSRASTRASTRPNSAGPGRTAMAGAVMRQFSDGPHRRH
jgi:hypothetical protein